MPDLIFAAIIGSVLLVAGMFVGAAVTAQYEEE